MSAPRAREDGLARPFSGMSCGTGRVWRSGSTGPTTGDRGRRVGPGRNPGRCACPSTVPRPGSSSSTWPFIAQGVRTDVWAAALWTDRRIAQSTLHSTSSVARRSLGRSESGVDHLPRRGRLLRLEDTVGTDVDTIRPGRRNPRSRDGGWMRLRLVRGRAFDGLGLCDWAVLDGTQAQVESMVVDTALKAAAHYLRRGQGEEAEWVARRGTPGQSLRRTALSGPAPGHGGHGKQGRIAYGHGRVTAGGRRRRPPVSGSGVRHTERVRALLPPPSDHGALPRTGSWSDPCSRG